jgi:predicted ATPase/DNA-binding CsgD family transcriptional regulator
VLGSSVESGIRESREGVAVPDRQRGIPLLPSPLIGRQEDVRAARQALLEDGVRLLTLTGPPGVGKTSLALTVARGLTERSRHGASLVDLAPVTDPALVGGAIVDALGVGTTPGRRPLDRLVRAIGERERLLVLDNFEQVVGAAPLVADLLAACPALAVIVTSREPLRLRWEHELPVAPLPVPESTSSAGLDVLAASPAVRLLVERARAVSAGFTLGPIDAHAVAEICRRLDGLPLAIELAAARMRLLSPSAILERLIGGREQRSDPGAARPSSPPMLAGGPRDLPPRQQSLHDAIAWSYGLLDAQEQALFRRLAVFSGGCTFEAAEVICDASWEGIASLIEKSLLRQETPPDGELRVRMLETIRDYALSQLAASGEAEALQQRHAAYFVDLAERAEPELTGPRQAVWLERLDRERDNFRAAASWAAGRGEIETMLRLGAALIRYWRTRGDAADVRERVEGILALAATAPPLPATVKAFYGAGDLARVLGDYVAAQSLLERSLQIAREIDDRAGLASVLCELCKLAGYRGRYGDAHRYGEESLALLEELGDLSGLATALREVGMIGYLEDRQPEARRLLERGRAIARQLGDQRLIGNFAFSLALTHHVAGELATARRLYDECLAIDLAVGSRASAGSVLGNLGNVATLEGDVARAPTLFRESLAASREAGDRRRLAFTLSAVAGLAATDGAFERAVRLDAAASTATAEMGARLAPGMRAVYDSQLELARNALGEAGVAASRAAGQSLSLEQVVDEALSWLERDAVPEPTGAEPAATTLSDPVLVPRPDEDTARASARTRGSAGVRQGQTSPRADVLTRRERDVAVLIGRGMSNREIAETLVITEGTAESYVHRVLTRLDFTRRAQVAAWAVAQRLHELHVER